MTDTVIEQAIASVDPATPAPAEAPAPAPAEVERDIDDVAFDAAVAEAKAEEAAAAQPQADAATGQPAAAAPAAAQPQTIPKARFDEVNARARQAEEHAAKLAADNAYLRGLADARGGIPATGTPAAPPAQQTPEQRLAAVRAEKATLAKQFDEGELTMADFEAKRDALEDKIEALRDERLNERMIAKTGSQASEGSALYVETITRQLEKDHPWVGEFEAVGSDADWNYLKQLGIERCISKGIDIRQGEIGRYELRKAVAEIADELGPSLLASKMARANRAAPAIGQTSQPQPTTPPLSPSVRARQAKLDVAAGAPPDLAAMPGVPANPGVYSEAQVMSMSEDEYARLPEGVRQKLLGITP